MAASTFRAGQEDLPTESVLVAEVLDPPHDRLRYKIIAAAATIL
jgi:hypothetical protein